MTLSVINPYKFFSPFWFVVDSVLFSVLWSVLIFFKKYYSISISIMRLTVNVNNYYFLWIFWISEKIYLVKSNILAWVVWKIWCKFLFPFNCYCNSTKDKRTQRNLFYIVNVSLILISALQYFNIQKITTKGLSVIGTEMMFQIEGGIIKGMW